MMGEKISLNDMNAGETGKVVELIGGWAMQNRLSSMGIRPGVEITRVNPALGRGPVVINAGGTQTALGFGMSYKIIVEVEK